MLSLLILGVGSSSEQLVHLRVSISSRLWLSPGLGLPWTLQPHLLQSKTFAPSCVARSPILVSQFQTPERNMTDTVQIFMLVHVIDIRVQKDEPLLDQLSLISQPWLVDMDLGPSVGTRVGGFHMGSFRWELACLCCNNLKSQLRSYLLSIFLLNYCLTYLLFTILYF